MAAWICRSSLREPVSASSVSQVVWPLGPLAGPPWTMIPTLRSYSAPRFLGREIYFSSEGSLNILPCIPYFVPTSDYLCQHLRRVDVERLEAAVGSPSNGGVEVRCECFFFPRDPPFMMLTSPRVPFDSRF